MLDDTDDKLKLLRREIYDPQRLEGSRKTKYKAELAELQKVKKEQAGT